MPLFICVAWTKLAARVAALLVLGLAAAMAGASANAAVTVVAGTGVAENNGDRGPALQINIGDPFGVEIGPDGALYITEVRNHRIRRLDLQTGEIDTVAGCGRRGYSGDGGPAVDAEMFEPYEVRFDSDGHMYVVEMQNHVVRRVDAQTNVISTVAGVGRRGFGGDGGPAVQAAFSSPHSIALDGRGNLYVADIGNHRVRRIDLRTGVVDTVAGSAERRRPTDGQAAKDHPLLGPRALFIHERALWIALREGHSVWRLDLASSVLSHAAGAGEAGYGGDDGAAERATFNGPKGIAIGPNGDVIVADTENHAIRRIDARTGRISTIAGGALTGGETEVGDASASAERLNRPHGVCVGRDGAVFVGDTLNHRVVRID
jgi:streptogramin lyase